MTLVHCQCTLLVDSRNDHDEAHRRQEERRERGPRRRRGPVALQALEEGREPVLVDAVFEFDHFALYYSQQLWLLLCAAKVIDRTSSAAKPLRSSLNCNFILSI